MKKTITKTSILAVFFFSLNLSFAQNNDAEGCKDHPLVDRMPNFSLFKCEESYNEMEVVVGEGKKENLEGTVYNYEYYINDDVKAPSIFQILKNYENAIVSKGGEKIYSHSKGDADGYVGATFRMKSAGDTYWLTFTYFNGSDAACDGYFMSIIKVEGMKQEITANEMFEKINSGNSLMLYINFETGKSLIKSESQAIIDQLHQMLKENPSLKIVIEGHTDNVGNKASNQTLSEQRAASVKQALVKKEINTERIKTVGYGQDKPIADNTTEDGKAQNRRVEIKKM